MSDSKTEKENQKQEKIVEARLRLRQRFADKMQASPSLADTSPMGSGPPNRHGMPVLPPGQTETRKWPVLDLGMRPKIRPESWTLEIDGACQTPLQIDLKGLKQFDLVEEESDFHCVTAWSQMNLRFKGVRLVDLIAAASPQNEASHIMCYGSDGYTTNLALEEAIKPDVLVAFGVDGGALPQEHGGPARVITPQLYAWKGAKWVSRIELLVGDKPGFWEERGYSMTALPWREDRYSL